ncbi:transcriptional regulator [Candidatus Desantisbacteria bacterium CG_4_10_14_3_um_filter_40_18]|uniref:Transcriptional regulator n=1 Tax=Candidatus Desantisbacteria bacterium CG_4_10_14_3_um_filter_40_18 TaxID=1974544 RepID=A0A2M7P1E4_9BACT|nr:MAG: transcriptional regulator [Candidatus Desantisbacteria bacterium CG_4_10_14_3_um_filter_40_18]
MCQVFTSPKRLEILNLLKDKELSVNELADLADIPQSNLSQHLTIMREKGMVNTRREGTTIYYSMVNPKIIQAFDIIREILLEKLAQTEKLSKKLHEI